MGCKLAHWIHWASAWVFRAMDLKVATSALSWHSASLFSRAACLERRRAKAFPNLGRGGNWKMSPCFGVVGVTWSRYAFKKKLKWKNPIWICLGICEMTCLCNALASKNITQHQKPIWRETSPKKQERLFRWPCKILRHGSNLNYDKKPFGVRLGLF